MFEKRTITIFSTITDISSVESSYDLNEGGLRDTFILMGYVNDDEAPEMDGKECRVEINRGSFKEDRVNTFSPELAKAINLDGVKGVCGLLHIEKYAEYSESHPEYKIPPVGFNISIPKEDFYALKHICNQSIIQQKYALSMWFEIYTINFLKEALEDEIQSTRNLDFSNVIRGAIRSFRIIQTDIKLK